MTISSTVTRNDYVGAGSVGPYVYGFKVYAATELQVIKRSSLGVETVLAYLSDYTVTGAGNDAGGTITLTIALAVGESLAIRRNLPLLQSSTYRNQGPFFPETIEDQLDRTIAIQQQQQDAIDRSVKLASSLSPSGKTTTVIPTAGAVITGDGLGGFTMGAVSSGSTVLPGGGRSVATLSAYLANNAVFNIRDYGADPTGLTDATAAINAAAVAALAAGGTVTAPAGGVYLIAGPVLFRTSVDMRGVQFNAAGTGIAVQIGLTGTLTQQLEFRLPRVSQTLARPVGTWPRADVGIKLIGCIGCTFVYGGIDAFSKGLQLLGESNGCDYNVHYLETFTNNKIGIYADGGPGADNYCNENLYIGGRLQYNYGELTGGVSIEIGQVGTRHIFMGSTNVGTDSHRFIGTTLEGHVAEYVAELRGSHHTFDRCRWETDATLQRLLLTGTSSAYNRILGGYNANKVKPTFAAGAGGIEIQQQDGLRANTSAANGHFVVNNGNGPDSPSFMIVPDPFVSAAVHATAYQVRLSDKSLRGKATADTSDRIAIDFSAGTADVLTLKSGASNSTLGTGKPSMSAAGKFITLASGASYTVIGVAYATFDMVDSNSGHSALIKTNGGAGTVVYQDSTVFSGTSGTASKINVYATGGNLVIQNNTAGVIALSGTIVQLV